MDTLEKLRKLAIDQTHPGPACKPGEHYDSDTHHCVKVPAAEKAKDKPAKHQASGALECPECGSRKIEILQKSHGVPRPMGKCFKCHNEWFLDEVDEWSDDDDD